MRPAESEREGQCRESRLPRKSERTESKDLDAEAKDDDGLEVASVAHNNSSESSAKSAREGSDGADASGRQGRLVAGDDEEGVEVSTDDSSGGRVDQGDDEANDDGAVGEEREGNERVARGETFPQDEGDGTDTSDDEECNAVSCEGRERISADFTLRRALPRKAHRHSTWIPCHWQW
jgi:hypothetical protein